MTGSKARKHIGLQIKLEAALLQLGIDPKHAQLDHSPPLALREWDPAAEDTIPPANDPRHLVWMSTKAHREKTSGRHKHDIANSDIHKIAKAKRLRGEEKPAKPKKAWPSRPFPNKEKTRRR